jgi:hypothetical protein
MDEMFVVPMLLIIACSPSYQVLETKSDKVSWEEDAFIYEDEMMLISYDFWGENGNMVFTVFNKTDKPLYLDWSKSSLIKGSKSFKYWKDIAISNGVMQGISYDSWFYANIDLRRIKARISIVETKPEKVSFIEPSTMIGRRFSPIWESVEIIYADNEFDEERNSSKPEKLAKVYSKTFDKDSSPLQFRNYLTFAFDQNFTTEFSIDTEFYVSKVLKMPKTHFERYRPAYSKDITYPFKKSNSVYQLIKPN